MQEQKEFCQLLDSGLEWNNILSTTPMEKSEPLTMVETCREFSEIQGGNLYNLLRKSCYSDELLDSFQVRSLSNSNFMKLSYVGLYQQISQIWEIKRNFHQKRVKISKPLFLRPKGNDDDQGDIPWDQYA